MRVVQKVCVIREVFPVLHRLAGALCQPRGTFQNQGPVGRPSPSPLIVCESQGVYDALGIIHANNQGIKRGALQRYLNSEVGLMVNDSEGLV